MTIAKKMAVVLAALKALPPSRAASLAITKLEEAALWSACAVQGVDSPIEFLSDEPKKKAKGS